MDINQLIQACKSKNRKGQEQLYNLYAPKLYSVCLKYSRNKTEADDNLQDSFITIYSKIDQYKHKGSFEGWMRRITVNTVLQKYRNEGVFNLNQETQIEDVTVDIEDEDISLDYLLNLIQELPDRYRLTFNLYVLDGYSHKEIAKMLHISDGTSKSNLARARMILKDKIEKDLSTREAQSL
ncbi:RNA polymerase sigma factor [Zhouia sp. PK063]|uniref:RNA polymerase sigma factor n=1 Tax=Zhouia sp. PK063 TaxID=3373602 RepID=UPI0037A9B32C